MIDHREVSRGTRRPTGDTSPVVTFYCRTRKPTGSTSTVVLFLLSERKRYLFLTSCKRSPTMQGHEASVFHSSAGRTPQTNDDILRQGNHHTHTVPPPPCFLYNAKSRPHKYTLNNRKKPWSWLASLSPSLPLRRLPLLAVLHSPPDWWRKMRWRLVLSSGT